jgi:hypothetical protein
MFGYTIIKKEELDEMLAKEWVSGNAWARSDIKQPTLNCGYKSCQFMTTDARGLKIHRSRVHRKK